MQISRCKFKRTKSSLNWEFGFACTEAGNVMVCIIPDGAKGKADILNGAFEYELMRAWKIEDPTVTLIEDAKDGDA